MSNAGRPSQYDGTVTPQKVVDYLATTGDKYVNVGTALSPKPKLVVELPSIEGLALYLGVHKDTIYDWESKFPEFSDALSTLRAMQGKMLINKGLTGEYMSPIAKLLLSSHGYKEETKTDVTQRTYIISEE